MSEDAPKAQTLTEDEVKVVQQGYSLMMNPEVLSWAIVFARATKIPIVRLYMGFRTINREIAQIYREAADERYRRMYDERDAKSNAAFRERRNATT